MSQFIPRPMNIREAARRASSPGRIKEIKEEEEALKDMRDNFPVVNDGADDGEIMYNEEIGLEYSYIPGWLEKISRKYLCLSLVRIEQETLRMYNIVKNHQICTGIGLCCNIMSELSDDLIVNRIF